MTADSAAMKSTTAGGTPAGSNAATGTAPLPNFHTIASAGRADTFGWDTCYAVRVPFVNAALATSLGSDGQTKEALRITCPADSDGMPGIDATFGAWKIAAGGSGKRIVLDLPIDKGTATFLDPGIGAGGKQEVSLAGVIVRVEVSLGFHPAPQDAGTGSLLAHLKVITDNHAPAIATASDVRQAAVTPSHQDDKISVTAVTNLTIPDVTATKARRMTRALAEVINDWLIENDAIFDYVFLSVDIAERAAVGSFAWIKPTTVGFAVTDLLTANGTSSGVENSIFAILAMTEKRAPTGAALAVSANAIPKECDSAFLISRRMFIEKFIFPSLPHMFTGAKSSDFAVSDTGTSVKNIHPLTMTVEMDRSWEAVPSVFNGKYINASIATGNFTITVEEESLGQSFSNVTFPYGIGGVATVDLSVKNNYAIGIDDDKIFALRANSGNICTFNVNPDPEKASATSWTSLVSGIFIQLAMFMVLRKFAALRASRATNTLTQQVESELTVLQRRASSLSTTTASAEARVLQTAEQQVVQSAERQAAQNAERQVVQAAEREAMQSEQQIAQMVEREVANLAPGEAASLAGTTSTGVQVATFGRLVSGGAGTAGKWVLNGLLSENGTMMLSMIFGNVASHYTGQYATFAMGSAYDHKQQAIDSVTALVGHALADIRWHGTPETKLTCAGLNGTFVMGFKLGTPS